MDLPSGRSLIGRWSDLMGCSALSAVESPVAPVTTDSVELTPTELTADAVPFTWSPAPGIETRAVLLEPRSCDGLFD